MAIANAKKDPSGIYGLSKRDKEIIDYLCEGRSSEEAAIKFRLTQPRISQIKRSAAGLQYLGTIAQPERIAVHNIALIMLRERLELVRQSGYSVKLETLLAIIKALEPKDSAPSSTVDMLHEEANRIADEMGMPEEDRGKLLQFVRAAG